MTSNLLYTPLLRHGDTDIFHVIHGLKTGDPFTIAALILVAGFIAFAAMHQKVTGESFVKGKKERRRARERRKHVVWKYERDE